MQGILLPDDVYKQSHGFADDFHGDTDGFTDSGTAAFEDAVGGVLSQTTGTTANNESFRKQTKECFLLAAGKPLRFRARVKFTDASGTTGALFVGLSSEAGAAIVANGGESVKSGDQTTLAFVKLTGSANWTCYSKVSSTAQSDELTATNKNNLSGTVKAVSSSYQWLQIDFVPDGVGAALVTYSIDGVEVCKHRISLTSAAIGAPIIFVKTTTSDAQVVYADFWDVWQTR